MSRYSKTVGRLKKNYSYTTARLEKDFGFHPQTVRRWVKDKKAPLPTIQQKPLLIFSEDLRAWLKKKDSDRKTSLELKEFLCMACHTAKEPLEDMVYLHVLPNKALMKGNCPTCGTIMNKKLSCKNAALIEQFLLTVTLAELHILGRTIPSKKAHLKSNGKSTSSEPVKNAHLFKQKNLFEEDDDE